MLKEEDKLDAIEDVGDLLLYLNEINPEQPARAYLVEDKTTTIFVDTKGNADVHRNKRDSRLLIVELPPVNA